MDLALQALEDHAQSRSQSECHSKRSGGLLSQAVRGGNDIPLEGLVRFVRLSYTSDQREIVELLAERLVQDTQVCVCVCVQVCRCAVGVSAAVCLGV